MHWKEPNLGLRKSPGLAQAAGQSLRLVAGS